jgi:hypothetical protein
MGKIVSCSFGAVVYLAVSLTVHGTTSISLDENISIIDSVALCCKGDFTECLSNNVNISYAHSSETVIRLPNDFLTQQGLPVDGLDGFELR